MKKKFNKKGFQKKSFKKSESADSVAEPVLIENLNSSSFKKKVALSGMIDRIIQTVGRRFLKSVMELGLLRLKDLLHRGKGLIQNLTREIILMLQLNWKNLMEKLREILLKLKKQKMKKKSRIHFKKGRGKRRKFNQLIF